MPIPRSSKDWIDEGRIANEDRFGDLEFQPMGRQPVLVGIRLNALCILMASQA